MENQQIHLEGLLPHRGIELFIKREDLIHPVVSGNKFRKLKYNLLEVEKKNYKRIITFGGAYSNHIAATAYAAKEHGVASVGVIRGEELAGGYAGNPTLEFAESCGMVFKFVSRSRYREKDSKEFKDELLGEFGDAFLLPEGGSNELAVKGCEEILHKEDENFNYICTAVGTGGTVSGIIRSATPSQTVLGFPALKGQFLKDEILKFVSGDKKWELIHDFHFGGYAKIDAGLVEYINNFKAGTQIQLDPVYTGKMMYGIFELIKNGYFEPNSRILAIHTGGLQGIDGMNQKLKQKKLPLLQ